MLESLPNWYSAPLAHVCTCVTGLQHSALYRFGRFAKMFVPFASRELVDYHLMIMSSPDEWNAAYDIINNFNFDDLADDVNSM